MSGESPLRGDPLPPEIRFFLTQKMIETRKAALESFRAESLESLGSKAPEPLKNFAFQRFGDEDLTNMIKIVV